jgi:hypothetical protein
VPSKQISNLSVALSSQSMCQLLNWSLFFSSLALPTSQSQSKFLIDRCCHLLISHSSCGSLSHTKPSCTSEPLRLLFLLPGMLFLQL